MDAKKALSSAPEIFPSLSLSKCWKILRSSDFLPLLPVPDDLLLEDDDDDRATGLATSDWPHSSGRPSLKLLLRVRPLAGFEMLTFAIDLWLFGVTNTTISLRTEGLCCSTTCAMPT
jgi:hypothetical protein